MVSGVNLTLNVTLTITSLVLVHRWRGRGSGWAFTPAHTDSLLFLPWLENPSRKVSPRYYFLRESSVTLHSVFRNAWRLRCVHVESRKGNPVPGKLCKKYHDSKFREENIFFWWLYYWQVEGFLFFFIILLECSGDCGPMHVMMIVAFRKIILQPLIQKLTVDNDLSNI